MNKTKGVLKNIANGLLYSFLSRNNDVYGYWGMGKLYSLMLRKKTRIVSIDLIKKTIEPEDKEFDFLINQYQEKLIVLLVKKNMDFILIKKAKVILKRESIESCIKGQLSIIECEVIIQSINNIVSFKKKIKCRKHNPRVESKSTRNYEN